MQTIKQSKSWKEEAINGNFKKIPDSFIRTLKLSSNQIKKEIYLSKLTCSIIKFCVERLIYMGLLDDNYELTMLGKQFTTDLLSKHQANKTSLL